jgi:hypothetical protein
LVGSGDAQRLHETKTRDLSAGGAYIYISDPELSIGDELDIEIVMTVDARCHLDDSPRQVTMKGHGKVTRKDSDGLGMKFSGQLDFG